MPRTILAAWNGRREAARAVFDSIPLLGAAESVEVLTIDERPRDEASLPDTEIAAGLSRHGVHVKLNKIKQDTAPAAR